MELLTSQHCGDDCVRMKVDLAEKSTASVVMYDKEQLFGHFSPLSNEDSDLFLQASVEQLGRILRKYYGIGMETLNTSQITPTNPTDGPSIINHVINHLQFRNNCTLVHLAARYNNNFVLNWLLSCCCDENCKHEEHSIECLNRQEKLWSTVDKNNSTPLFYACLASKTSSEQANFEMEQNSTHPSHDSIVFLLSQPSVKSKQLNYHIDQHGNLPIVVAIRRRDYILADLLVFFGAKINVTVGLGIGSSESILHSACRDRDMKLIKFIGPRSNKVLLKRNQRDENCIFSCLRDFRSNQFQSSGRVNSNLSMHSEFLREFLQISSSSFGVDIFEKALIMKNSYGRNLLLESVVLFDHESMKVICQFLANYQQQPDRLNASSSYLLQMSSFDSSDSDVSPSSFTSSSSGHSFNSPISRSKSVRNSSSLIETLVFDTDKQGNSILHLMLSTVIKSIDNIEDFMWLFDGMKWLLTWMENNFKPTSVLDSPLTHGTNVSNQLSVFIKTHKNNEGFTVSDLISIAKRNEKTEWAISVVSEKLKSTIRKWIKLDNHEIGDNEEDQGSETIVVSRKSNSRFSKSFPANALTMSSSIQVTVSGSDNTPSSVNNTQPRNKLGFLAKLKLGRRKK